MKVMSISILQENTKLPSRVFVRTQPEAGNLHITIQFLIKSLACGPTASAFLWEISVYYLTHTFYFIPPQQPEKPKTSACQFYGRMATEWVIKRRKMLVVSHLVFRTQIPKVYIGKWQITGFLGAYISLHTYQSICYVSILSSNTWA